MSSKRKVSGLSMGTSNLIMSVIALVIAVILIISLFKLSATYHDVVKHTDQYMDLKPEIEELEKASDYLTEQVRLYVITEDEVHINNYLHEVRVDKRREDSLSRIGEVLDGTLSYQNLKRAFDESYDLMNLEYHAMALVLNKNGSDITTFEVDYPLLEDELSLSDEEKYAKAINLVFGDTYQSKKETIKTSVEGSAQELDNILKERVHTSAEELKNIMIFQQAVILVLILFLGSLFTYVVVRVVLPLRHGVGYILGGREVKLEGIREYKYLANAYNIMRTKNQHNKEVLTYEVEHDKLTGLYNRHGYDTLYANLDLESTAYMLIDVDNFKKINDMYGHAVGDKVLKKVSSTLKKYFRNDDYLCRIGGDEFAVLLVNCGKEFSDQLKEKSQSINITLQVKEEDIPPVSISIGLAFGEKDDNTDTLFRKADTALYNTKKQGRSGISIFEDEEENKNANA